MQKGQKGQQSRVGDPNNKEKSPSKPFRDQNNGPRRQSNDFQSRSNNPRSNFNSSRPSYNNRNDDNSYSNHNNNNHTTPYSRDRERSYRNSTTNNSFSSSPQRKSFSQTTTPSSFQQPIQRDQHSTLQSKQQSQPQQESQQQQQQESKPATNVAELPEIDEAQKQKFIAKRARLNNEINTNLKYAPYIGTVEKNPQYKPFINAISNIGGITHLQLFQLHLYTQCLLASQRHKFDLSIFNDGYYNNAIFPLVPDYFPYLNVTALRQPDLIFNQHLADALSIIPTIEAHVPEITTPTIRQLLSTGVRPIEVPLEIVDVGSGGGVPAIILAIMRPSWKITAIDSVGKKCQFLRHTADRLGLGNFTVIAGSSQHYCSVVDGAPVIATPLPSIPQYGNEIALQNYIPSLSMFEAYDICVARGVTQMPQLLPICMPLVKPGGKFIAMKSLLSSLPKATQDSLRAENPIQISQIAIESIKKVNNNDNNDSNNNTTTNNNTKTNSNDLYKPIQIDNEEGLEVEIEFEDNDTTTNTTTTTTNTTTNDDDDDIITPALGLRSKKKKSNHGETFKREQAQAITTIDNFDTILQGVLASPWVPSGRHTQAYSHLSLELQESLPNLKEYGGSHKNPPVFVHTDIFFQVNAQLKNNGYIREQDDIDNELINTISERYFPRDAKFVENLMQQDEGKVGETAKYLCVIDKVFSVPPISKGKDMTKKEKNDINNIPTKPKPLTGKELARASKKYQFPDPHEGTFVEGPIQENPKIVLKKQFQEQKQKVREYEKNQEQQQQQSKPQQQKPYKPQQNKK